MGKAQQQAFRAGFDRRVKLEFHGSRVMHNARLYAWHWTMVWALGFAILVGISLWLSEGHIIYTLDDPYIHLAVAENIAKGGYGVTSYPQASG
jgi:hypothetical protein